MAIFLRNIQLLICLVFFCPSSLLPWFTIENVHAHCQIMIDVVCAKEYIPYKQKMPLLDHLVEQVFNESTINFIVRSISEHSVIGKDPEERIIWIVAIESIIRDTWFHVHAFGLCPSKVQAMAKEVSDHPSMQQAEVGFCNEKYYRVEDAAWLVTNVILAFHFRASKIFYSACNVFLEEEPRTLNFLTLNDPEFNIFWKGLIQKQKMIALIQEEYLYHVCTNHSDEIFMKRMLDIYACLSYLLKPEQLPWCTAFPPHVLREIVNDWRTVLPQTFHHIPILSILMNMFADGWVWQKHGYATGWVLPENRSPDNVSTSDEFRSTMRKVRQKLKEMSIESNSKKLEDKKIINKRPPRKKRRK